MNHTEPNKFRSPNKCVKSQNSQADFFNPELTHAIQRDVQLKREQKTPGRDHSRKRNKTKGALPQLTQPLSTTSKEIPVRLIDNTVISLPLSDKDAKLRCVPPKKPSDKM